MGSRRGEWVAENRSLAGHGMDAKGIPNSYGYDANGDLLPYANHRPSYRPGQVEDVRTLSREELAPRLREGGDLADLPPLRHENEMWVQVRDYSGAEDIVDLGKDRGKWRRIEWYLGSRDWMFGIWGTYLIKSMSQCTTGICGAKWLPRNFWKSIAMSPTIGWRTHLGTVRTLTKKDEYLGDL